MSGKEKENLDVEIITDVEIDEEPFSPTTHEDTSNLVLSYDEDGQLSFIDPQQNYYPSSGDYISAINEIIDQYSNIHYFSNLGLLYGLTKIEERHKESYEGTPLGLKYKEIHEKGNLDLSEGLIARISAAEFIRVFDINRSKKTYEKFDELFNDIKLKTQWQVYYEDEKIRTGVYVLSGTLYDKEEKMIYLKFNYDLKPRLLNFKGNFAKLSQPVLGKLKDSFVTRLYALHKKTFDFETQKNIKYNLPEHTEIKWYIDIEEFYFLTGMFPVDYASKDINMQKAVVLLQRKDFKGAAEILLSSGLVAKYDEEQETAKEKAVTKFGYFKSKYMNKAFKKINGFDMPAKLDTTTHPKYKDACKTYFKNCEIAFPTDIHFRYEQVNKGLGGKVSGLVFYTSSGMKAQTKETQKQLPPAKPESEALTTAQQDLIEKVKNMILPDELSVNALVKIAKTAEWSYERIEKAHKVSLEYRKHKTIHSLERYLEDAIIKNWDPPVVVEAEAVEEYSKETVKKSIYYDDTVLTNPDCKEIIDLFVEIIYDTVNTDAQAFKIGDGKVPAKLVKEKLLKLKPYTIQRAIEAYLDGKDSATVPVQYVRTILYNGAVEYELWLARKLHKNEGFYQTGEQEPKEPHEGTDYFDEEE